VQDAGENAPALRDRVTPCSVLRDTEVEALPQAKVQEQVAQVAVLAAQRTRKAPVVVVAAR
jgi:hypothetical protein